MNALELAKRLEARSTITVNDEAAAMLRRQHEAIVKLRDAIETSENSVQWTHVPFMVRARLSQALKDTEEFQ